VWVQVAELGGLILSIVVLGLIRISRGVGAGMCKSWGFSQEHRSIPLDGSCCTTLRQRIRALDSYLIMIDRFMNQTVL
jgi:hypothetical protein